MKPEDLWGITEPANKDEADEAAQAIDLRSYHSVNRPVGFEALPARTQDGRTAGGGPSWRRPQ
jgi:hypothetical protein